MKTRNVVSLLEIVRRNQRAIALPAMIMFLLLVTIALPLAVKIARQESKMAVKSKHQNVAYQLASAGVDRAIWKLKETMDNWESILSTGYLTGYYNDVVYQDVNSDDGFYRIIITSVSDDEMQIVSTGKDSRAMEFRAITANVRRTQVVSPVHGYEIGKDTTVPFNLTVHWGPIIDTAQMNLNSDDLNQFYPLKYSASAITQSSGAYADRDSNPNTPNSDDLEYYAYDNIYPMPTPDLEYYRAEAQIQGRYYTSDQNFNNVIDTAPYIRFVDGANLTLRGANSHYWGHVFVMGNLTIRGNRDNGALIYTTTPPATAYTHYAKNAPIRKGSTVSGTHPYSAGEYGPDSVDTDEYPGDDGAATVKPFTFQANTCTSCEKTGREVALRGVAYVTGTLSGGASNPQVIHGALILPKGAVTSTGWFEVYYDNTTSMKTTTQGIYTSNWVESSPISF